MTNHTHAKSKRPPAKTEKLTPTLCPACGGLQCLCRPRFFAGQLLTEEDLNRLDHYILEKNKLHNRYLHGWGVVCGLEVVCHPCENMVTVKSGYALSPCGEDIVVCRDEPVPVCELIQKCKEKERRQWECEPPRYRADDACQDVEEDWILSICYEEKPSRGVTALRGSAESPCCSRCSCGGSSACGCLCHEQNNGTKTALRSALRRTPLQCEPTIICEGYRYGVSRAPVKDPQKEEAIDRGAMAERFEACWNAVMKRIPKPPTGNNLEALRKWCCSLKDNLRDLFMMHPGYDCLLLEQLVGLCPEPGPNTTYQAYLNSILGQVVPILTEYLRYCLCSTLLPPCPEPVEDPCVNLATITVRKGDCKIIRVCNWENRKFATTFPNLQYWLSWLPFVRNLRELLTKACCTPVRVGGSHAG